MKKQTTTRKAGASSTRGQSDRTNGGNTGRSNASSSNATKNAQAARGTEGLKKLFEHQLMDLYYVEKQLTKHLPKMAEAAMNEDLSQAFTDHLQETEGHVERLEKVFSIIGRPAKAQKCPAIDGILEEAKDLMDEFKSDAALDAALACAAQKVEHYEITSYGSLCAFAEQLGMNEVCDEIEATLDEEKAADNKLSRLAEAVLNIEAEEGSEEDESERSERTNERTTATGNRQEEDTDAADDDAGTRKEGTGSKSRSTKEYAEVH